MFLVETADLPTSFDVKYSGDLRSASDWLNQISHATRPIKSTTQTWVVTRHHYGISALVSQKSFGGETSGSVAKCRLFSQAKTTQEKVSCTHGNQI